MDRNIEVHQLQKQLDTEVKHLETKLNDGNKGQIDRKKDPNEVVILENIILVKLSKSGAGEVVC